MSGLSGISSLMPQPVSCTSWISIGVWSAQTADQAALPPNVVAAPDDNVYLSHSRRLTSLPLSIVVPLFQIVDFIFYETVRPVADLNDRPRRQRPALSLRRHRLNPRQTVAVRHKVAGYAVFVFREFNVNQILSLVSDFFKSSGSFHFLVRKRTSAELRGARMTKACRSAERCGLTHRIAACTAAFVLLGGATKSGLAARREGPPRSSRIEDRHSRPPGDTVPSVSALVMLRRRRAIRSCLTYNFLIDVFSGGVRACH